MKAELSVSLAVFFSKHADVFFRSSFCMMSLRSPFLRYSTHTSEVLGQVNSMYNFQFQMRLFDVLHQSWKPASFSCVGVAFVIAVSMIQVEAFLLGQNMLEV
jgi:hypothetical protein